MNKMIEIGGFMFPQKLYDKLIARFAEGFSHTSISCEKAFNELTGIDQILTGGGFLDTEIEKKFKKLNAETQEEIENKLHFFIVYCAYYKGVLSGKFDKDNQSQINKLYTENFTMFDDYIYKAIVMKENYFDERETYKKIVKLFKILPERRIAYEKCYGMKADHLSAFYYALDLPEINIKAIQEINRLVNASQIDQEIGYKKVDNIIQGANFATMKKEYIPLEISKLLYQYEDNFGEPLQIPDINTINKEQRGALWLKICEREARFHIAFERLHPFIDGNGRTGRIILNRNLIKNGLPPILITEVMDSQYKQFITENDYKGFGQLILTCTSQELTRWVSELRDYYKMDKNSIELPHKIKNS